MPCCGQGNLVLGYWKEHSPFSRAPTRFCNILADKASGNFDENTELELVGNVFREVRIKLGGVGIDLFASRLNKNVKLRYHGSLIQGLSILMLFLWVGKIWTFMLFLQSVWFWGLWEIRREKACGFFVSTIVAHTGLVSSDHENVNWKSVTDFPQ